MADEKYIVALQEWDGKTEPISEAQVVDSLREFFEKKTDETSANELTFEWMAFGFSENGGRNTNWGTYFGPFFVGSRTDGSLIEAPSISDVSTEHLDYWSKRAKEAKNPVFIARYAGLVWDFSKCVTGNSADYKMAQLRIDSICAIADTDRHKYDIDVIVKLEEALSLSIKLNNKERIGKVANTILEYEAKIAIDDKPGLWGFSFELLFKNRRVQLSAEQKSKLVCDLEERLTRVSNPSDKQSLEPWAAEKAALILAAYYHAENLRDDTRRVLLKYAGAFEAFAFESSATVSSAWFVKISQVLRGYGFTSESDSFLVKVRQLGPKTIDEMKEISGTVSIKKEDFDKRAAWITELDLETAVLRLAVAHIPQKGNTLKQLRTMANEAPLLHYFSATNQDFKGRPVALIPHEDIDGRAVRLTAKNILFSSISFRNAFNAILKKFNPTSDELLSLVYKSPLFTDYKKPILKKGIEEYLDGDTLVAIHLLVPQLEDAVRNLVELNKGVVLRPNKYGGMNLKNFGDLLQDKLVERTFGENMVLYFRVLFTDQRGINLRNNMCHGISPAHEFTQSIADSVLHALFVLALARKSKTKNKKNNQEHIIPQEWVEMLGD